MTIQVADILDILVSVASAPSTMGAQLERLKLGIYVQPDAHRQKSEIEDQLLSKAVVLRCLDAFRARESFATSSRQRKAADAGFKQLTKLQDTCQWPNIQQGVLAEGVLRAYQERWRQSEYRGLAQVYYYATRIAPKLGPLPTDLEKLANDFKSGKAKRHRAMASELYADCLLALQQHVRVFNDREKKR